MEDGAVAPYLFDGFPELKPDPVRPRVVRPTARKRSELRDSMSSEQAQTERERIRAWRDVHMRRAHLRFCMDAFRHALRFALLLFLILKGAPIVVSLAHHAMGEPLSTTVNATEKPD